MKNPQLAYDLRMAAHESFSVYQERYMRNLPDIFELSTSPDKQRAWIAESSWGAAEELIRFSVVFNDLTLVSISATKTATFSVIDPAHAEELLGTKDVHFRLDEATLKRLQTEQSDALVPAFWFPKGPAADARVADLAELVHTGRVLVQPDRLVLARKPAMGLERPREWSALLVDPGSPLTAWAIRTELPLATAPIRILKAEDLGADHGAFKLLIPYLRGISMNQLGQIIRDEDDLLSSLRAEVRNLLERKPSDYAAFAGDVLAPRVDLIGRKFRKIAATRALRIAGATVATAGVSLATIKTGLGLALPGLVGSGGAGWILKEYADYRADIDKLSEDPCYFLWRCKRTAKARR